MQLIIRDLIYRSPLGKVTSDLMVFDEMDSRLEFTFDNVQ